MLPRCAAGTLGEQVLSEVLRASASLAELTVEGRLHGPLALAAGGVAQGATASRVPSTSTSPLRGQNPER